MSVLFQKRNADLSALLATRTTLRESGSYVSPKTAITHSVVWAATRLRADIESLMPVDVFRKVGGVRVQAPTPDVLVEPTEYAPGQPQSIGEWIYSSRTALDQGGNSVGVIRQRDGLGLPAEIELVDPDSVAIRMKGSKIVEYRIAGEKVDSKYIWHERQYTSAGIPVGLSPITHAALQLSAGIAAQKWALGWFQDGAVPSAVLKNTEKALVADVASAAKASFKASVASGDLFVTGKDWEYNPIAAKAAESEFIAQMQYTDADLCRFMGVPADLIDVVVERTGNVTYANITQRNLQVLVLNMGRAIKFREDALSRLVPSTRFVKLNRSAFLAMDDKTRAEVFELRIRNRTITPDEVREYEDEEPFTETDYAQFDRLFGARTPNQPQTAGSN